MHLLFPLFSSVIFVFGMMFARKALGLWAIVFAWTLAGSFEGGERYARQTVTLRRATGALLLTGAVVASMLLSPD